MNDLFRTDALALAGVTGASALALLAVALSLPAVSRAHFDAPAPPHYTVRTAPLHGVALRPSAAPEPGDETPAATPSDEAAVRETVETRDGESVVTVGEDIEIVGDYGEFGISCCGDEGWYDDGAVHGWFRSRYARRTAWRWGMPRYGGAAPMFPWMGGGEPGVDPANRAYTMPAGGGTIRVAARDAAAEHRAAEARARRDQTRWTLENARVALTLDVSGECLADLDRVRAATPVGTLAGTYHCDVEETAVPWNDREGAALLIRETRDGVTTTVQVSLGDDDARPTVTGWTARRHGAVTEHVLANEGAAAMTWTLDGREVTVPAGRAITVRMRS